MSLAEAQAAGERTPPARSRRPLYAIEGGVEAEAPASSASKRLRCEETSVSPTCSTPPTTKSVGLQLFVKWTSTTGRCRLHNLGLRRIEDFHSLEGLPKDLLARAFPGNRMPHHVTSKDYYHFTPQEECLSLPSDISSTTFRLLACYDGWEYAVYERPLRREERGRPDPGDAEREMLVTVVEFESTAMVIGHLGIRIQLVAYPIISVRKAFLDDIDYRVRSDSNFKGLL